MIRYENTVYYKDNLGVTEKSKSKLFVRPEETNQEIADLKATLSSKRNILEFTEKCVRNTENDSKRDTLLQRKERLEKEIVELEQLIYEKKSSENRSQTVKLKRPFKKRSDEKVEEELVRIVKMEKNKGTRFVTKENLARTLKVKESQIEKILMSLNRKGLVSRPVHHTPHDCRRGTTMDAGWDNSWCGDLYYIL